MPSTFGMRTFFDRMPLISERLSGRTERNVCLRKNTNTKYTERTFIQPDVNQTSAQNAGLRVLVRRLLHSHERRSHAGDWVWHTAAVQPYRSRELRSAVYTLRVLLLNSKTLDKVE